MRNPGCRQGIRSTEPFCACLLRSHDRPFGHLLLGDRTLVYSLRPRNFVDVGLGEKILLHALSKLPLDTATDVSVALGETLVSKTTRQLLARLLSGFLPLAPVILEEFSAPRAILVRNDQDLHRDLIDFVEKAEVCEL